MLATALLLLPVVCRVLDFYASSLKEQMGGEDDDSSKKKKKKRKSSKKSSGRSPRYDKIDEEKANGFTMKLLVTEDGLSFSDVVKNHGWDSDGEAYLCAAARMLFCHMAQPVLYMVLFSLSTPDGDGDEPDRLQGLSLVCGWFVALREAVYFAATLACALKNPAFLLINVPATVNGGKDDDEDRRDDDDDGDSLCSGMTFLMAYVCAPQSFVLKALCGRSGLDLEDEVQFVLASSFFLDLFAVAALGSAIGSGTVSLYLWLTAFYGATAVGGIGAGAAYLQHDGSKLGPICFLLVAVAAGGGFVIGSGQVALVSVQTALICVVVLALGYVALNQAGGGSGDGSDSDDSDSGQDDSDKDSDKDDSDSDDSGSGDDRDGKKKFKVFDRVEVYSKSAGVWCEGEVKVVDPVADTVKVEYSNSGGPLMQKVLMTTSEDLRSLGKKANTSRQSSRSPTTRPRRMSSGALRKEMSRLEGKDDFVYQVRAEFKKGKMGFVFKGGENGEVYVHKVSKKTPAADVPHACAGMILRRYETKPNARWKKKKLKGDEDYTEVLDTIKDSRPIKLYFDHPWQYVPGKKGRPGHYSNWFEDADEDERPEELADVYTTMMEWMDADEDDTTDRYAEKGKGELTRTNTLRPYRCTVKDTKETGTFSKTTRYTIKCEWNDFVGESEHRYSGA
eukprot:COSAG02_NODE_1990_length_10170_cov_4.723645_5_plen_675_part_00